MMNFFNVKPLSSASANKLYNSLFSYVFCVTNAHFIKVFFFHSLARKLLHILRSCVRISSYRSVCCTMYCHLLPVTYHPWKSDAGHRQIFSIFILGKSTITRVCVATMIILVFEKNTFVYSSNFHLKSCNVPTCVY